MILHFVFFADLVIFLYLVFFLTYEFIVPQAKDHQQSINTLVEVERDLLYAQVSCEMCIFHFIISLLVYHATAARVSQCYRVWLDQR